jgi:hypothetical protein
MVSDNVFDENYRAGWGSGFGSHVSWTVTYRHIIESFIRIVSTKTSKPAIIARWTSEIRAQFIRHRGIRHFFANNFYVKHVHLLIGNPS